ncbi:MAG: 7-cyano-7-deazaguanine synthase QueC [Acidobacteriia bacterium]|jgi:7-cyano-7-deazaguanine synthase|nr:7-cyano-7-deazaguanine synthase QueC [Terriglobia bacterium]
MSKAVVLVSGGMDSCVTAAMARTTHTPAFLHVSYGQRTERRERQAFEAIADFYGVRERLVVRFDHLAQIGGSALTDPSIPVPEDGAALLHARRETESAAAARIPVTYVPFRNAHLLAVAVSWAEVLGATAVYIGAVAEDSSGYPDCRPAFYQAFQQAVREGTKPETHIALLTPVIALRKSEIVRRGIELGAPLHLTWSCYQEEEVACGVCDSCRLRLRAFAEAGVRDPLTYRVPVAR